MARALGFRRAGISQILDLLLAPAIQEEILFLECIPGRQRVSERASAAEGGVEAGVGEADDSVAIVEALKPVPPGSA
jgi:hypothetical protein